MSRELWCVIFIMISTSSLNVLRSSASPLLTYRDNRKRNEAEKKNVSFDSEQLFTIFLHHVLNMEEKSFGGYSCFCLFLFFYWQKKWDRQRFEPSSLEESRGGWIVYHEINMPMPAGPSCLNYFQFNSGANDRCFSIQHANLFISSKLRYKITCFVSDWKQPATAI